MRSRDAKVSYQQTKYGYWLVRFYCEDGKRRCKNCKTKTERDVLVKAIKKQDVLDFWFPEESKTVSDRDIGTFKSLAEKWLEHSEKVREISESCMINYRGHLRNHIYPNLENIFLRDLDIRNIEEVAKVLKTKKPQSRSYVAVRQSRMNEELFEDDEFLSTSYRREILTVACMITKFGFERSYISANPFSEYKLPECPVQPYDYWRLDEEHKFLCWLEDGGYVTKQVCKPFSKKKGKPEYFMKRFRTRNVKDLYDIVLFALRSGLRKGEIGALTRRDINFSKNCIVVRRSFSTKENRMKKTTKGKTFRIIEMNEDMVNILRPRVDKASSDSEVLFNIRTWAIKNFSKYCAKADVREIHFHSLRHTCLTNLANGYGMDAPLPLPQVREIAGHRDIATTMRYVHTNGIEGTNSRQWSRTHRKGLVERESRQDSKAVNGLRLVNSSEF